MHPLSGYQSLSQGYSGLEGQQQSPPMDQAGSPPSNGGAAAPEAGAGHNGSGGEHGAPAGGQTPYTDINTILDQIMNITDQSLDEAQVMPCEKPIRKSRH